MISASEMVARSERVVGAQHLASLESKFRGLELRPSGIHGVGLFAKHSLSKSEVVARYLGRRVEREGMYVVPHRSSDGASSLPELTGNVKYLNHSCKPNAKFSGRRLVALRDISADEELTIDYGPGTCDCRSHQVVAVDEDVPLRMEVA